ncbi:monofunctional biosynthetic peptidoglycan transglycosylase [Cellvibrio sp. KY-GH-1]|uniref:monofunctional biosynthetic peptidoglycan transglycosylase n=1 Tax=Cellvibrio sp. KY-GH-1 TaxID=2303332 RepID=UPI001246361D|nr:monofunctional biosynthetic peptidoglycan transglycosylase [Cellvibrio sp. KY-GH-1]QEY18509.1 monofunctional biosynthetic peptidoglycan transglycosylase [Cellvibrio sp. KY-GH-1]
MKKIWRFSGRILKWLLLLLVAYQLWIFAHVVVWKWVNPGETSFMAIRLDELQQKNAKAELKHQWVEYAKISNHLKRAVVAAEDDRFMDHNGFDLRGIEQALKKNERRGKSVAGGSSITQQLAKNLFLSPSRSYFRKAEEAVITLMIELLWDKRRILEVYLNVVEWGNGVFGAEAAARHYYRVPAAQLGASAAARMAVMLPNPRKYEKSMPSWVVRHASAVQRRMHYSQIP